MENQISIAGLNKAELLAALFNGSHAQGMGFLQNHAEQMTLAEAAELLRKGTYFDYVRGRVLKVDLKGDEFYTGLYNRDVGQGAAERIVEGLRGTSTLPPESDYTYTQPARVFSTSDDSPAYATSNFSQQIEDTPEPFTPGGGSFDGGGASASWDSGSSDSGSSSSDSSSDSGSSSTD